LDLVKLFIKERVLSVITFSKTSQRHHQNAVFCYKKIKQRMKYAR